MDYRRAVSSNMAACVAIFGVEYAPMPTLQTAQTLLDLLKPITWQPDGNRVAR